MLNDTHPIHITIRAHQGRIHVWRDNEPIEGTDPYIYLAPTAGGSPEITSSWLATAGREHGLEIAYRDGESSIQWACRIMAELCARHCGHLPLDIEQVRGYAGTKFGAASLARAVITVAS